MCYNEKQQETTKQMENCKKNVSNKHTFAAQYKKKYCISICNENSYVCDREFVFFSFRFIPNVNANAKRKANGMYNFVKNVCHYFIV